VARKGPTDFYKTLRGDYKLPDLSGVAYSKKSKNKFFSR
jgi:hypothetical protein